MLSGLRHQYVAMVLQGYGLAFWETTIHCYALIRSLYDKLEEAKFYSHCSE